MNVCIQCTADVETKNTEHNAAYVYREPTYTNMHAYNFYISQTPDPWIHAYGVLARFRGIATHVSASYVATDLQTHTLYAQCPDRKIGAV